MATTASATDDATRSVQPSEPISPVSGICRVIISTANAIIIGRRPILSERCPHSGRVVRARHCAATEHQ